MIKPGDIVATDNGDASSMVTYADDKGMFGVSHRALIVSVYTTGTRAAPARFVFFVSASFMGTGILYQKDAT